MDDLKEGDILVRISDGSLWEFLHYGYGLITVRADTPNFKGGSGKIKSMVHVKPLKSKTPSGNDERGMAASEFEKRKEN